MAAPHVPPSPQAANTGHKRSSSGSLFDFLLAVFSQSPPWVRVVIALGVFSAAGFGIYRWISTQAEKPQQEAVYPQYPITKGKKIDPPGNANGDPRNQIATQQVADSDAHFKWHALHEKHEPEWTIISKADEDNFVEYKYYKDTDRCVLLYRKENGEETPRNGSGTLYSVESLLRIVGFLPLTKKAISSMPSSESLMQARNNFMYRMCKSDARILIRGRFSGGGDLPWTSAGVQCIEGLQTGVHTTRCSIDVTTRGMQL